MGIEAYVSKTSNMAISFYIFIAILCANSVTSAETVNKIGSKSCLFFTLSNRVKTGSLKDTFVIKIAEKTYQITLRGLDS